MASIMKKLSAALLLLTALTVQPALADRSTPEAAKRLVEDAAAYVREKGVEAAAKAFNDPKGAFVRNDLYVFMFDDQGRYVASGGNPGLAGTDASGLKDAEGKPIVQEMIAETKSKPSAVVEYVWLNRASNKIEHKHSFIIREGSYIIGSGYYTD